MKKAFVLFASFVMLFAVCATANAGGGLIVKAGINYSDFNYKEDLKNIKDFDYKNFAGYHAGIGFQTGSLLGFSLQPELLYQVESHQIEDAGNVKMNAAQLAVAAQWGIDLLVVKPFVFASPYFSYKLSQAFSDEENTDASVIQKIKDAKFDYGIGLGVGVEIFQFVQVTAKYNWGFGEFKSWKEVADNYKDKEGYQISEATFLVSLALKF